MRRGPFIGVLGVVLMTAVAARADDPRFLDLVKASNRAAVRARIARTPTDAKAADADGTTALHFAAQSGDVEIVKLLLRAGANPNAANRQGVTPLVVAVMGTGAGVSEALLAGGADARTVLPNGQSVLMLAARTGDPAVVRALVEHHADVSVADPVMGETALMWAASEDHADTIGILAKAGAKVDTSSKTMTFSRQKFGDGKSARFTVLPRGGWTPLMYAARQNAPAAVRALAEAGASLDTVDPDGTTALTLAIINAHYDLAALLLDLGANPNVADNTGMTPLYAVVDMHTVDETPGRPAPVASGTKTPADVVRLLLAKGATPDAALKSPLIERVHNNPDGALGTGATPLMRASRKGDLELMRMLLDGGASPKARTAKKGTALLYTAGLGGLVRFGEYDLTRASDAQFVEAMTLLLDRGASVNDADENGQTVLHVAAAQREEATIRFLLSRGASPAARDAQGRTPIDVAMGVGQRARGGESAERPAIAELLRSATASVATAQRPE